MASLSAAANARAGHCASVLAVNAKLRYAPATERNRGPILAVLRRVLPAQGTVLEIASGTGEHACHFAAALSELTWQPSDPDPDARASIAAWAEKLAVPNVKPPLSLDAESAAWPAAAADAIVCINMIHIAPWEACEGLLAGASRLLPAGAPLVLYGPFRLDGVHTAPSNESFDASLRARDPRWGVRDVDDVSARAAAHGFAFEERVAMPANNQTVVYRAEAPAQR